MQEQSSDKENRLPAEIRQTDEIAPAKGNCLHITQDSKGVDFGALLEQVVQYVSMGDPEQNPCRDTICGADSDRISVCV